MMSRLPYLAVALFLLAVAYFMEFCCGQQQHCRRAGDVHMDYLSQHNLSYSPDPLLTWRSDACRQFYAGMVVRGPPRKPPMLEPTTSWTSCDCASPCAYLSSRHDDDELDE